MKIEQKIKIKVPPGQSKIRIDKYLTSHIENASRTKVQRAIEEGYVLVNSKIVKCNYNVSPRDDIDIFLPNLSASKPEVLPENIKLDILYEDEYLLVVNKPAGMVTHPAYKNYSGTLVNALLYYIEEESTSLSSLKGYERAGIVHRLDKNTSGLLLVAKDDNVHMRLGRLFSRHDIEREYWAMVWGHFDKKLGVIEKALGRSQQNRKRIVVKEGGKSAITEYEVISEFEFLSLVKLHLRTGRTHQIRVHMHSVGHPVFGDPEYEGRKPHGVQVTNKLKEKINVLLEMMPRQALHAKVLGFTHPITNRFMHFESELPADMLNLIKKCK